MLLKGFPLILITVGLGISAILLSLATHTVVRMSVQESLKQRVQLLLISALMFIQILGCGYLLGVMYAWWI